ncbi:MAG TPA: NAD(P)-dependent oxidoreductase [Bryobacteraceae bacterium]|jgi:3-hydroxyisobutyrate dehydrogenase-like beta-hydroxyacid dehydrogenase|nr:NAD(P)-dependent oxidoreductase [Bryobacteraceae bacterium]
MRIGFVGLGKMGAAMAQNLLRAGNELTVYNRSREKAEALAKEGAKTADSPAEVARASEAVFSMMPDDEAAEEITLGNAGIAAGLAKNAVHISSSTISIKESRHLEEEHEKRGSHLIAATVFGRPQAAESKQLVVVTAGRTEAVERCKPLLNAIGRRTFVVGEQPWQANLFKLFGNFMIATTLETFGEAFAGIRKAGADHHEFYEIMSELFGSPVYKNYGKIIADQEFEPAGFELKLGFKDVRLAMEAATEFNAPLPIANVLRDHFLSALAHGQEKLDWSSIGLVSARNSGLNT